MDVAKEQVSADDAAEPGSIDGNVEIVNPAHRGARIIVRLEPPGKYLSLPRPKIARQLLAALGLAEESALVARDGKLLTPDRHIYPNERILVRLVCSRG